MSSNLLEVLALSLTALLLVFNMVERREEYSIFFCPSVAVSADKPPVSHVCFLPSKIDKNMRNNTAQLTLI